MRRDSSLQPPVPPARHLGRPHTLVARMDSAGDVLLQGPAIRAVAAGSRRVTMLCSPRGAPAAELLPGVDELVVYPAEWVDPQPRPVRREAVVSLVDRVTALRPDTAVVFTSFHQSPLPLALLLRMAGVRRVGAISADYPGSLLDVRHQADENLHEVERSLSLAAAMGFGLPPSDTRRLRVRRPGRLPRECADLTPYVVVHPGASVPARAWSPEKHAQLVRLLISWGRRVVVTGSAGETGLCARVAGPARPEVLDLCGRTDLATMAEVLAAADVVVCGNTGPAHLAAAVGTPVVSLFAPVVPACRWRPWRVPHVLLGNQDAACAGSRARTCPVPGHPCLETVPAREVVTAIEVLLAETVISHRTAALVG
jgi:ADP-heptose:LPS heptosyltransferase